MGRQAPAAAPADWSVYWANSRDGLLQVPPVVGGFSGGVGRFYSDETYAGRPVTVRYTWSEISAVSALGAGTLPDGRRTWEVNWVMEFTRRP